MSKSYLIMAGLFMFMSSLAQGSSNQNTYVHSSLRNSHVVKTLERVEECVSVGIEQKGMNLSKLLLARQSKAFSLDLLTFYVEGAGCENILFWSTANESGVSHFEIERSSDGFNFTMIGTTSATNNPSFGGTYKFWDNAVDMNNHYRLRIVNMDTSVEYSPVEFINSACSSNLILNVYSNPVTTESIKASVTAPSPIFNGDVFIYDVTGKEVFKAEYNFNEGDNIIELSPGNLSAGTYFLLVKAPGFDLVREKVSVVK